MCNFLGSQQYGLSEKESKGSKFRDHQASKPRIRGWTKHSLFLHGKKWAYYGCVLIKLT